MSATAGPARQGSRHYWGIRSQTLIAAGVVAAFCVLVLLAFGVTWRSGERIMEGARVRTHDHHPCSASIRRKLSGEIA